MWSPGSLTEMGEKIGGIRRRFLDDVEGAKSN